MRSSPLSARHSNTNRTFSRLVRRHSNFSPAAERRGSAEREAEKPKILSDLFFVFRARIFSLRVDHSERFDGTRSLDFSRPVGSAFTRIDRDEWRAASPATDNEIAAK